MILESSSKTMMTCFLAFYVFQYDIKPGKKGLWVM